MPSNEIHVSLNFSCFNKQLTIQISSWRLFRLLTVGYITILCFVVYKVKMEKTLNIIQPVHVVIRLVYGD